MQKNGEFKDSLGYIGKLGKEKRKKIRGVVALLLYYL
jgi:hypothetical protein